MYVLQEPQFDWDEANAGHISRHGISPEAVERVFANDPIHLGSVIHEDELRHMIIGPTDSGRLMAVIFTRRREKIRVVTAYPANRRQRNIYEAKQEDHEDQGS